MARSAFVLALLLALALLANGISPLHAATVAAGYDFSCAVVNGGVQCWGANDYGQLGNPAFSDTDTATDVAGLRPGSNAGVTAVTAGTYHACAIANGGLQCWGYNANGQLGLSDTTTRNSPQLIPSLTGVKAVAAGDRHTCAIAFHAATNKDAMFCWGYNSDGQLGVGDTDPRLDPTWVFDLLGTGSIAAGNSHTCALDGSGVSCWGANKYGQLGLGDIHHCNAATTTCLTPTPVSGVPSPAGISTGYYHTCAVTMTGSVYCWGDGSYGQTGFFNPALLPQLLPSLQTGATTISAGSYFTCAVVNNTVKCWGYGGDGQQGNGQFVGTDTPHGVSLLNMPPPAGSVTEVAAGDSHACARYNNILFCWGAEAHGQLGSHNDERVLSPIAVGGIAAAKQLASGQAHTCALTGDVANGMGQVSCWGSNAQGQIGDGTYVDASLPKTVVPTGATLVANGVNHTCALVSGSLTCWGANYYGQLGLGNLSSVFAPGNAVNLMGVKAVAGGYNHTCAIAGPNSAVYCWGTNDYGQLGLGNKSACLAPPYCSSPISIGLTGATAIAAGWYYTCAVANGTVWCWGDNGVGEVGQGNNLQQYFGPTQVPMLSSIVGLSAHSFHTCALTASGAVSCWGSNSNGQLGLGTSPNYVPSPQPVLNLPTGAIVIAAGIAHTCAIPLGFVTLPQCWGAGAEGQLGTGYLDDWRLPTPVSTPNSVTAIATGDEHSCAIQANGTVLCWGNSLDGRLGNGSNGLQPTPVIVFANDTLFGSRFEVRPGPGP